LLAAAETRAALKGVKTRARQPRRAPTRRPDASLEEGESREGQQVESPGPPEHWQRLFDDSGPPEHWLALLEQQDSPPRWVEYSAGESSGALEDLPPDFPSESESAGPVEERPAWEQEAAPAAPDGQAPPRRPPEKGKAPPRGVRLQFPTTPSARPAETGFTPSQAPGEPPAPDRSTGVPSAQPAPAETPPGPGPIKMTETPPPALLERRPPAPPEPLRRRRLAFLPWRNPPQELPASPDYPPAGVESPEAGKLPPAPQPVEPPAPASISRRVEDHAPGIRREEDRFPEPRRIEETSGRPAASPRRSLFPSLAEIPRRLFSKPARNKSEDGARPAVQGARSHAPLQMPFPTQDTRRHEPPDIPAQDARRHGPLPMPFEGAWPDLPDDLPPIDQEWEKALQAVERRHRLDREQRGL
jgi:hypothetical protein